MPAFESKVSELPEQSDKTEEGQVKVELAAKSIDLLKESKDLKSNNDKAPDLPVLTLTESGGEKEQKNKQEEKNKPDEHPKSKKEKIVNELKHFGEGLASGLAITPINGFTQLLNHVFHTKIGKIKFPDQAELDKSIAGKIGSAAGDALFSVGTGGIGKAVGMGGKALAATAAVREGVFTPTNENKESSFWKERINNAAAGASKVVPVGKITAVAEASMNQAEKAEELKKEQAEKAEEQKREPIRLV